MARKRGISRTITREILNELYWSELKSVSDVGKQLGVCRQTADYYLRKFGIPVRTRGQGTYLRSNKDFPDFNNLSEHDWKLLAWIIALEGSIGFQSYKTGITALSVNVTDPRIIVALKDRFHFFKCQIQKTHEEKQTEWSRGMFHTDKFFWKVSSLPAVGEICKNIWSYLPIKKATAKTMHAFCESRLTPPHHSLNEFEKRCMRTIKDLNSRQIPYETKLAIEARSLEWLNANKTATC